jgi:hypothetical protein
LMRAIFCTANRQHFLVPVGYLHPTGGGYSANDASYGLTAG